MKNYEAYAYAKKAGGGGGGGGIHIEHLKRIDERAYDEFKLLDDRAARTSKQNFFAVLLKVLEHEGL